MIGAMRFAAALLLLVVLAAPKSPDVEAPGDFWRRLPAPRKGDWLAVFPEKGQTFAEYKRADPVRGSETRRRIYLQPWLTRPSTEPNLLSTIADLLGAWFGREVTILEPQPIPRRAYEPDRRQYRVTALAARLIATLPDDALFVLAVTDRELALGKLAYAFGWGSMEHRVGVMSTHRLDVGPDRELRRRRLVALAVHEASHMLSLPHCTFYRCLMNGARTPEESDRRPLLLCPVCRAKLCWNLEMEPLPRYRALISALDRTSFSGEARNAQRAMDVTEGGKKG